MNIEMLKDYFTKHGCFRSEKNEMIPVYVKKNGSTVWIKENPYVQNVWLASVNAVLTVIKEKAGLGAKAFVPYTDASIKNCYDPKMKNIGLMAQKHINATFEKQMNVQVTGPLSELVEKQELWFELLRTKKVGTVNIKVDLSDILNELESVFGDNETATVVKVKTNDVVAKSKHEKETTKSDELDDLLALLNEDVQ
jgi:hypothetical protein